MNSEYVAHHFRPELNHLSFWLILENLDIICFVLVQANKSMVLATDIIGTVHHSSVIYCNIDRYGVYQENVRFLKTGIQTIFFANTTASLFLIFSQYSILL